MLVVGCGNVGTFLSTSILQDTNHCHLTILEQRQDRVEQVKQFGVGYQAGTGDNKISAQISPAEFSIINSLTKLEHYQADIVFIATKSYQLTPEFYRAEIEPYLAEHSKIVLLQNGYPNPEILGAIGNKAVVMVVNAGFSLDANGQRTVTNKLEIDLPYGSLSSNASDQQSTKEIADLFLDNPPTIKVRYEEDIVLDVLKKTQYACIGAYCAVEAFKTHHPKDKKFTFGNLTAEQKDVGRFTRSFIESRTKTTNQNISDIAKEVEMIAGVALLSPQELQDRIKINTNLENSLVTDARNGCQMELEIVDNLLILARERNLETPALNKLSKALGIIAEDRWDLKTENVKTMRKLYAEPCLMTAKL